MQKAGNKVRITAQLIDALTGHHLWAERYDRDLRDYFALLDEITIKIMTAMQVEFTAGELSRVYAKGTDNFDAYIKVMQGYEHFGCLLISRFHTVHGITQLNILLYFLW